MNSTYLQKVKKGKRELQEKKKKLQKALLLNKFHWKKADSDQTSLCCLETQSVPPSQKKFSEGPTVISIKGSIEDDSQ